MTLLDETTWRGRIYSSGWVETGTTQPVIEPATGSELGSIGIASPEDLETAAAGAVKAQQAWAALPYDERAGVLRRAGDLWAAHSDEVAGWISREAGSIMAKGQFETSMAAQECYEAAGLASHPYGELLRSHEPRLSLSRRVPAGIVGVIAPFNFPLILSIRAVAPALALGNAVILKPDPRTAVSGGATLAAIFEEAGLPAGLLSVLPGGADVGEALVTHRDVRVIAFTGSTRAGRRVGALAAEHLKRVHLELGGNSALLVLDDVDVEKAAGVGAWGSFFHQGQICMTTGRHLVHEKIAAEYAERLAAHAAALPVGDPASGQVALGPLIDAGQRDNVHAIVTETIDAGATLVTGGTYDDLFYRPTVLTDVPTDSAAFEREIFGPVAPVVTVDSVDEAVELARRSEYGLSLGILTSDAFRGLEIAERIPSGLVHINDQTVNDEAVIPFGGVLASGTGSRHGGAQANLDAFTETQWVTVRRTLPTYPF